MRIYTEIIGNLSDPEWGQKAREAEVERIELDQWTAQKSRFMATGDRGNEYGVALKRHSQLLDGDIIEYRPEMRKIVVIGIRLNDVLVADLSALRDQEPETIIHTAVELGHAIGNQHWPAVVKGTKVYVPLTVDRKVMDSVMRTHHIERVACTFQPGSEVIPYLAPHEIRRLFGGTGPDSDVHRHAHPGSDSHGHEHVAGHPHEHATEHPHEYGTERPHEHEAEHAHDHAPGHGHAHEHEQAFAGGHAPQTPAL